MTVSRQNSLTERDFVNKFLTVDLLITTDKLYKKTNYRVIHNKYPLQKQQQNTKLTKWRGLGDHEKHLLQYL